MEDLVEEKMFTVQRRDTSVPASEGEKAGPMMSRSSDCSVLEVDDLASNSLRTTSGNTRIGDEDYSTQTTPRIDPFKRSSKITRSPTRVENLNTPTRQNVAFPTKFAKPNQTERSFVITQDQLKQMKHIIQTMKTATNRQRNISNDVKNGLSELEEAIDSIAFNKTVENVKDTADKTTRHEKRPASMSPEEKNEGKKKKEKENNLSEILIRAITAGEETKTCSTTTRNAQRKEVIEPATEMMSETATDPKNKEKERRLRERKPRTRPDALLIKPAEGKSFADVLGIIRKDAKPDENSTEIRNVRRTYAGDILLELGPKTTNKEGFSNTLKEILGEQASILMLEPKSTLEIRDLDDFTTEEEVKEAFTRDFGTTNENIKVYVTKPNARAQKVAIVNLCTKVAEAALRKERIRIGLVNCKIQKRIEVVRCNTCFGYGHTKATCKGPNRRNENVCLKCGEKGHKKSECKGNPKCFLCEGHAKEEPPDNVAHIAGSGACPVFRKALEMAKKRA